MNNDRLYPAVPEMRSEAASGRKGDQLLRLIRAAQPVTRTEIAERLSIDKSTVTDNIKPLVTSGVIIEEQAYSELHGRKARLLSFADDKVIFGGVNFGVRRSQVGLTTL